MSFVESQLTNNADFIEEIRSIKLKLETALARIKQIELSLNIPNNDIDEKIKQRKINPYNNKKEILNIILVDNDEDVPIGYCSLLVVTSETEGELLTVDKDDLKNFCINILTAKNGSEINILDHEKTNKIANFQDGIWSIIANSE